MTTAYEIPFAAGQPQTQVVSLNGTPYTLTTHWCDPAQCWMMDVADQYGTAILSSVPLVPGLDLLAQFQYLGIGNGGAMLVQSSNDPDLVPSFETLGDTGHVFFISPTP